MTKKYLLTQDAAEYLGLSRSYLAKLRCRGGGPEFIKAGSSIRYCREKLDQWMADRRRNSTSEYRKD